MVDNSSVLTTFLSLLLLLSYFFLVTAKTNYETQECIQCAKERLIQQNNKVGGVFFVPDHPVKKILLGLIYLEKKFIKASLYQLTDQQLLDALIDAHKRGIAVEIITDKSCLKSKYEKITELKKIGIKVYVYQKYYSIMHHKFWVFGKNRLGNKPLAWYGSANATEHGLTRNQEYVTVDEKYHVVKAFLEKFDRLKQAIVLMNMPKHILTTPRARPLFDVRAIRPGWFFK